MFATGGGQRHLFFSLAGTHNNHNTDAENWLRLQFLCFAMASAPFCAVAGLGWAGRGAAAALPNAINLSRNASWCQWSVAHDSRPPCPLFINRGLRQRQRPRQRQLASHQRVHSNRGGWNWGGLLCMCVSARSARGKVLPWCNLRHPHLFSTWCSRDIATPPVSCAWGPRLFPLVSGFLIGHSWLVIGEDAALVRSLDKRQGPNPGRCPGP